MELIYLPKFLELFDCKSVSDCWLNTDCIINESGITANNHHQNEEQLFNEMRLSSFRGIEHVKLIEERQLAEQVMQVMDAQYIKLDFPCTEQDLYEWARRLDEWENNHPDEGKQSHNFERVVKKVEKKWQPASDFFRNWSYWQYDIKKKIGTAPFDINWDYWLDRPTWTKEKAARLVSGFEPDQFHQVKSHADYQSMREPLVKLLRLIPDDLSRPLEWLTWFNENGYLKWAPKRLRDWYGEALNNGEQDDGAGRQESKDVQQRPGINGKRDLDAAEWYKTKKPEDVEKMTVIQIQTELKARDTNRTEKIWEKGFNDWKRTQLVYPKKKPGIKSGK